MKWNAGIFILIAALVLPGCGDDALAEDSQQIRIIDKILETIPYGVWSKLKNAIVPGDGQIQYSGWQPLPSWSKMAIQLRPVKLKGKAKESLRELIGSLDKQFGDQLSLELKELRWVSGAFGAMDKESGTPTNFIIYFEFEREISNQFIPKLKATKIYHEALAQVPGKYTGIRTAGESGAYMHLMPNAFIICDLGMAEEIQEWHNTHNSFDGLFEDATTAIKGELQKLTDNDLIFAWDIEEGDIDLGENQTTDQQMAQYRAMVQKFGVDVKDVEKLFSGSGIGGIGLKARDELEIAAQINFENPSKAKESAETIKDILSSIEASFGDDEIVKQIRAGKAPSTADDVKVSGNDVKASLGLPWNWFNVR